MAFEVPAGTTMPAGLFLRPHGPCELRIAVPVEVDMSPPRIAVHTNLPTRSRPFQPLRFAYFVQLTVRCFQIATTIGQYYQGKILIV